MALKLTSGTTTSVRAVNTTVLSLMVVVLVIVLRCTLALRMMSYRLAFITGVGVTSGRKNEFR